MARNRFNGFMVSKKTAEAVLSMVTRVRIRLKPGVNETCVTKTWQIP
jgi:hypothetical protein